MVTLVLLQLESGLYKYILVHKYNQFTRGTMQQDPSYILQSKHCKYKNKNMFS